MTKLSRYKGCLDSCSCVMMSQTVALTNKVFARRQTLNCNPSLTNRQQQRKKCSIWKCARNPPSIKWTSMTLLLWSDKKQIIVLKIYQDSPLNLKQVKISSMHKAWRVMNNSRCRKLDSSFQGWKNWLRLDKEERITKIAISGVTLKNHWLSVRPYFNKRLKWHPPSGNLGRVPNLIASTLSQVCNNRFIMIRVRVCWRGAGLTHSRPNEILFLKRRSQVKGSVSKTWKDRFLE